jgi:hypothetical protein
VGIIASLGQAFLTENDVEYIIFGQFWELILWTLIGFGVTVLNPIGLTLMLFTAGKYILLCFQVVRLAIHYREFHELTNFSLVLFALSPPGLLIGFCAIQLLLWHWQSAAQFRQSDSTVITKNQLPTTNN